VREFCCYCTVGRVVILLLTPQAAVIGKYSSKDHALNHYCNIAVLIFNSAVDSLLLTDKKCGSLKCNLTFKSASDFFPQLEYNVINSFNVCIHAPLILSLFP
jgi:hypothetical protein